MLFFISRIFANSIKNINNLKLIHYRKNNLSMSKKTLYLTWCICSLSHADCIDKFIPDFNNGKITINGNKNMLTVSNQSPNSNTCNVTSSQLEKFVNKNFIKYSADKSIVVSWNYLAINKQPIYDYLKDLKDYDEKYTDSTNYTLYGVANQSFACYKYTNYSNVDGTAHPNYGSFYNCAKPNNQNISIRDVVSSKDILSFTLENSDIKRILKKTGIQPSSIKNLNQLYAALNKNDDMQCILSGELPTQFAITKLNNDRTINVVYSLGTNAPHVCQAATPSDIVMTGIKPLIPINNFITLSDLKR